jgi:uncharacterized protein YbjT (DUF2867 family)
MPQQILVIGGNGRTGRHIVQKLKQHGYAVRVLTRDISTTRKHFDANVDVVAGDITQAASVRAAMQDIDGCVITVESSDSDHSPNSPQKVHYEGTRHVLAAANHTTHIVLVTQIYITRPDRHSEIRNIIHWRGQAEQALRTSGLPYTIVRPSWLTNNARDRAAIRFEQGDTGEGQISREDVAKVCVQSFLHPEAQGKTFEIYNAPGASTQDWAALFQTLVPDGA